MICILYKNNAVIQFLSLLILHISFHKYGILLDPFNLPPWLLFQERLNPIFCQKKRPPRANPRRSENSLFMRFISDYSMIEATLPEPTVLPPSRIANVRPWLIAIGWMSSIVISTLSPGMHISVPAGRLHTPVTSVVLK